MSGPCARRRVQAVLITAAGEMFLGENLCLNPQPVCPREPGEGYEKCKSICMQPMHAEIAALQAASDADRTGSRMIVSHTHACEDCGRCMMLAGVSSVEFVGKEL